MTRRSGSVYGRGVRRTARMTEKIAVVAPIARASVATAATAKPGARRSPRVAYRRSWRKSFTSPSLPERPSPASGDVGKDPRLRQGGPVGGDKPIGSDPRRRLLGAGQRDHIDLDRHVLGEARGL